MSFVGETEADCLYERARHTPAAASTRGREADVLLLQGFYARETIEVGRF